jgi:glycosidase
MNYRFAVACQDFFVNQAKAETVTQFDDRLNQMIYSYPLQTALVQMNLFDSHDTDRIASMFMNPDVVYDASNRIQDNGPHYNPAKPGPTERMKQKQAVALQMCFVGAPMTYYGDENGMWSPDDPSNRQPMVWKDLEPYDDPEVKFDNDLFSFYQRAIALREHLEPLQTGFFRPIKMDDAHAIFAFARQTDQQCVYVVLNRSSQPQIVQVPVKADGAYVDWMNPEQAQLTTASDHPEVTEIEGAEHLKSENGVMSLQLSAYETAVISPAK